MTRGTPQPQGAADDITAEDFELAEAALVVTDTRPGAATVPAIRLLRDECGWTLRKAKKVLDLIRAGRGSQWRP